MIVLLHRCQHSESVPTSYPHYYVRGDTLWLNTWVEGAGLAAIPVAFQNSERRFYNYIDCGFHTAVLSSQTVVDEKGSEGWTVRYKLVLSGTEWGPKAGCGTTVVYVSNNVGYLVDSALTSASEPCMNCMPETFSTAASSSNSR